MLNMVDTMANVSAKRENPLLNLVRNIPTEAYRLTVRLLEQHRMVP
jgi:hypothetical protein